MPVTVYPAPEGIEPSSDYRLKADGQTVFLHACSCASYAMFEAEGPVEVGVEVDFEFERAVVRPLRRGIEPERTDTGLRFALKAPALLSVELDGDLSRPLFIWAAPPEENAPAPDEEGVRFFEAGTVHEPGLMEMGSGETVYLEGGAVVRGAVLAEGAENVTVRGRGVLDGSGWPGEGDDRGPRMLRFIDCRNVRVEGLALVDSPRWTLVPTGCDGVEIEGVKIITDHVGGDGVDLVGCRSAVVEDCFFWTADDCVAIKASAHGHECGGRDVENIRVRRCVCWNAKPGNGVEIGYETRCDTMTDIAFEDLDLIHVQYEGWQSGGALTIHNGDRAEISNVRYEDIRIEGAEEKLIDLKILYARYSRDPERGQIRDVHFRDVAVVDGTFPVSVIRGWDADHLIEDVTIENLTVHGRPIRNANEAKMVVELARNVRFE